MYGRNIASPSRQSGIETSPTSAPAPRSASAGGVQVREHGLVADVRIGALARARRCAGRRRPRRAPPCSRPRSGSARTHCASRQSPPAITSSSSAAPSTVRASGVTKSIVWSMCVIPHDGTSPCVPFAATTPQNAAGMRPLPPWSTPSERSTSPARTAAPDPPDEPPAERVGSTGFRAGPERARLAQARRAEVVHVQLPDDRPAGGEDALDDDRVVHGRVGASTREPFVVGTPASEMLSLSPTVRPASGPDAAPSTRQRRMNELNGFSSGAGHVAGVAPLRRRQRERRRRAGRRGRRSPSATRSPAAAPRPRPARARAPSSAASRSTSAASGRLHAVAHARRLDARSASVAPSSTAPSSRSTTP